MEFGCISSGGEGDELGTGSAGFVPLPAMRGEVGDLTTLTDPSGFRFQVSAKVPLS